MRTLFFIFPLLVAANACPDLWTSLDGRCYKTSGEPMDWYAAQQYCVNEGGYLAEIESDDEQGSLYLVLSVELNYWIGLADFAQEGVWVWQHSYQQADYFYWQSGEPGGDGDEDCAVMRTASGYAWADLECNASNLDDRNIHALCEADNVGAKAEKDSDRFV